MTLFHNYLARHQLEDAQLWFCGAGRSYVEWSPLHDAFVRVSEGEAQAVNWDAI